MDIFAPWRNQWHRAGHLGLLALSRSDAASRAAAAIVAVACSTVTTDPAPT